MCFRFGLERHDVKMPITLLKPQTRVKKRRSHTIFQQSKDDQLFKVERVRSQMMTKDNTCCIKASNHILFLPMFFSPMFTEDAHVVSKSYEER
jgi:hypothetical protein